MALKYPYVWHDKTLRTTVFIQPTQKSNFDSVKWWYLTNYILEKVISLPLNQSINKLLSTVETTNKCNKLKCIRWLFIHFTNLSHARNMELLSVQKSLQSNHHIENSNILLLAICFLYFITPIGQHQHHKVHTLMVNKPPSSSISVWCLTDFHPNTLTVTSLHNIQLRTEQGTLCKNYRKSSI